MGTMQRNPHFLHAWGSSLVLCFAGASAALADPPTAAQSGTASGDAQPVPSGNFFSSLKQAFKQDLDHEVVRGHFDVGSPPEVHRYYCLMDAKTGRVEANGVGGQPFLRPDGMTGIKSGAVTFYSCLNAEQQGTLVTTGYALSAGASGANAPASPAQKPAATAASIGVSADKVDVAGVRLGMSPDQVRAVLKSKKLLDYYESAETLGPVGTATGARQSMADGRFVNLIKAWMPPAPSSVAAAAAEDGESFEVMFTPVPGRERAMAIVHSASYSRATAIREMSLENALVTKYGGYAGVHDLPESPTWRFQSSGNVLVGDPCNRRVIFGGLGEVDHGTVTRQNMALKTTVDEFRFQIDHCGIAFVTEDHATANADAAREDRVVARFTVTAYSPAIGLEGATLAAQLIQTAENERATDTTGAARTKNPPAPNL